jgi:predicted nucleic acid-binding protein
MDLVEFLTITTLMHFDATMRREGITEALTNDKHFEQKVFRCYFESPDFRPRSDFV